jgi:type I restriction enzyme, S subunit
VSLTRHPAEIIKGSSSPLLAKHSDWPRVELGEVATIQNGAAFKSSLFDAVAGVPLIRIRDLGKSETSLRYRGEYDDRYLVHPGQMLIGMDGDFRVARWEGETALLNQRVCRLSPDPEKIVPDFLLRVLPGYLEAIQHATSSTTVRHLSSRDIARIPIPLPALADQRRIAERLDQVERYRQKVIERLQTARANLQRVRGAVLHAACSGRLTADWRGKAATPATPDLRSIAWERRLAEEQGFVEPQLNPHAPTDDLPAGWTRVPLGLVLADVKYGTSKRSSYEEDGTPVLRIPNVSAGRLDISDLKFANIGDREIKSLRLEVGDLLMIRSNGSVPLVGITAMVTSEGEGMAYAGYLMRLRVDRELMEPDFLRLMLATPQLRNQIEIPARSTSGVHNINQHEVRALGAPLPSRDEQTEIVRRATLSLETLGKLVTKIDELEKHLSHLHRAVLSKTLRQSPS